MTRPHWQKDSLGSGQLSGCGVVVVGTTAGVVVTTGLGGVGLELDSLAERPTTRHENPVAASWRLLWNLTSRSLTS